MGLKTFDTWPDGKTTVDKEHWTSEDPIPEDNTKPDEEEQELGLQIAIRPINMFSIMRAEIPLEIVD